MPELQYTELTDLRRGLNTDTLSKLITDDRTQYSFADAPATGIFGAEDWRLAAYSLLEAEQDVEDILSARYEVPLGPGGSPELPEHVKGRVIRLAVYKLYLRSPGMSVPEGVEENRERALAWLKSVAEGEYSLNLAETAQRSDISSGDFPDSVFNEL